jgi:hypothetical protein
MNAAIVVGNKLKNISKPQPETIHSKIPTNHVASWGLWHKTTITQQNNLSIYRTTKVGFIFTPVEMLCSTVQTLAFF